MSRRCSAQVFLSNGFVALALILISATSRGADDFGRLYADRTAIERIYYLHRTGTKAPFEQVLTPLAIQSLVRHDLKMEVALKRAYRVEITPIQIDAEVQRIESTTRAPEILTELKQALSNDRQRFARTVAKPIVVERELRRQFESDSELHAQPRRQAERLREQLINARKTNAPVTVLLAILKSAQPSTVSERTWQLSRRAVENAIGLRPPHDQLSQTVAKSSGGPYSLEGIASLGAPGLHKGHSDVAGGAPAAENLYFEDLPPDLQRVLQSQLNEPDASSAVIETSAGFLVFVATGKSAEILAAGSVYFPKRDFEEWVEATSR